MIALRFVGEGVRGQRAEYDTDIPAEALAQFGYHAYGDGPRSRYGSSATVFAVVMDEGEELSPVQIVERLEQLAAAERGRLQRGEVRS